jgi:hypothetical protein
MCKSQVLRGENKRENCWLLRRHSVSSLKYISVSVSIEEKSDRQSSKCEIPRYSSRKAKLGARKTTFQKRRQVHKHNYLIIWMRDKGISVGIH